jgi:hypothetical protein
MKDWAQSEPKSNDMNQWFAIATVHMMQSHPQERMLQTFQLIQMLLLGAE